MINLNEIKKKIYKEVTTIICDKYGFSEEDVKISFNQNGGLKVSINLPSHFLESLGVDVNVFTAEIDMKKETE